MSSSHLANNNQAFAIVELHAFTLQIEGALLKSSSHRDERGFQIACAVSVPSMGLNLFWQSIRGHKYISTHLAKPVDPEHRTFTMICSIDLSTLPSISQ
jgi:hypothetical protein